MTANASKSTRLSAVSSFQTNRTPPAAPRISHRVLTGPFPPPAASFYQPRPPHPPSSPPPPSPPPPPKTPPLTRDLPLRMTDSPFTRARRASLLTRRRNVPAGALQINVSIAEDASKDGHEVEFVRDLSGKMDAGEKRKREEGEGKGEEGDEEEGEGGEVKRRMVG
ncbi:hypothetical protein EDC01DRAFT_777056 [Geopyxis carbonaria]|nr:hypothetical protein EDC01DRAFT_777056 [Geopyxis carbonaria]